MRLKWIVTGLFALFVAVVFDDASVPLIERDLRGLGFAPGGGRRR